ncbi:MAG: nuclear transport factor 2 family protein [Flavobacterium sp.]|nr:nuclear transport factor 2 family protein [Flavobacterium sp.]
MKQTLLMLLLASAALSTQAQTEEAAVKATVNQLFTAMKTSNQALLTSCFADSALLQTIATDKQGKTVVQHAPIADFAKQIAQLPIGAADERITFGNIQIDGALANVWAPYQFYYNGNFSHCGVNNFVLVKQNNVWKIQYIIDTRRKDGCGQ